MSETFTFSAGSTSEPNPVNITPETEVLTDLLKYPNWLKVRVSDKKPVGFIDSTDAENLHYLDDLTFDSGEVPAFQLGTQEKPTPFAAVDWDDVAENREFVSPEVTRLVMDAPAGYKEWSVSGTGLHSVFRGSLDADYKNRSNNHRDLPAGDAHIEMYDSNRYVILTGDTMMESTPEPRDNADYWQEFQREHFPKHGGESESQYEARESTQTASTRMVRYTLDQYQKSNSGLSRKAEKTLEFWDETPARLKSDASSERDLAFIGLLRFWCKNDRQLVEDCLHASSRWDGKWADHSTYLDSTIEFAFCSRMADDVFENDYLTPPKGGDSNE